MGYPVFHHCVPTEIYYFPLFLTPVSLPEHSERIPGSFDEIDTHSVGDTVFLPTKETSEFDITPYNYVTRFLFWTIPASFSGYCEMHT